MCGAGQFVRVGARCVHLHDDAQQLRRRKRVGLRLLPGHRLAYHLNDRDRHRQIPHSRELSNSGGGGDSLVALPERDLSVSRTDEDKAPVAKKAMVRRIADTHQGRRLGVLFSAATRACRCRCLYRQGHRPTPHGAAREATRRRSTRMYQPVLRASSPVGSRQTSSAISLADRGERSGDHRLLDLGLRESSGL